MGDMSRLKQGVQRNETGTRRSGSENCDNGLDPLFEEDSDPITWLRTCREQPFRKPANDVSEFAIAHLSSAVDQRRLFRSK